MTSVVKNSVVRCELCETHARAVVELSALNAKAYTRQKVLEKSMHEIGLKLKRIQRDLEEIAQHVTAAS